MDSNINSYNSSMSENNFQGSNTKLFVLPCLQETAPARKVVGMIGMGKENEAGGLYVGRKIDSFEKTRTSFMPKHFFPKKIDKLEFVERWLGNSGDMSLDSVITKEGLLQIPQCLSKYNCNSKMKNREKLWTDLVNFLITQKKFNSGKRVAMMVSHAFRMINNLIPSYSCNYYNNCSCVEITIDKSIEGVSVINRVIEEGTHLKKGKVHCNYIEERDELLERIFERNGDILKDGTYTLFIVRHGNGLHNSPIRIKTIDSCLTPLGVLQAHLLGRKIRDYRPDLNLSDILVCVSFLRRSQHTALGVLEGMFGSELEDNLFTMLTRMNKETLVRCYYKTEKRVQRDDIDDILKLNSILAEFKNLTENEKYKIEDLFFPDEGLAKIKKMKKKGSTKKNSKKKTTKKTTTKKKKKN